MLFNELVLGDFEGILRQNIDLADHFAHMVQDHDYFNFDLVDDQFVVDLMG